MNGKTKYNLYTITKRRIIVYEIRFLWNKSFTFINKYYNSSLAITYLIFFFVLKLQNKCFFVLSLDVYSYFLWHKVRIVY